TTAVPMMAISAASSANCVIAISKLPRLSLLVILAMLATLPTDVNSSASGASDAIVGYAYRGPSCTRASCATPADYYDGAPAGRSRRVGCRHHAAAVRRDRV